MWAVTIARPHSPFRLQTFLPSETFTPAMSVPELQLMQRPACDCRLGSVEAARLLQRSLGLQLQLRCLPPRRSRQNPVLLPLVFVRPSSRFSVTSLQLQAKPRLLPLLTRPTRLKLLLSLLLLKRLQRRDPAALSQLGRHCTCLLPQLPNLPLLLRTALGLPLLLSAQPPQLLSHLQHALQSHQVA